MRPFTLQRLQVFCSVYEQNSISAAARQLRLSQPTVSRHLRDFEHALGMPLFILDKGRIIATAQADELYLESRFLQDGLNRLENRIGKLREGAGSTFCVMSIGLMAATPLSQAISELIAELPGLRVTVDIGTADQQINLLRAGLIDMGIFAGEVHAEDVTRTEIGKGRLVAVFPAGLDRPSGDTVMLEDLVARQAVALSPKGPIGRILNQALIKRGLSLDEQIVGNSIAAVPHLAENLRRPAIVDNLTALSLSQDRFTTKQVFEAPDFSIQVALGMPGNPSQIAVNVLTQHLRLLMKQIDTEVALGS